MYTPASSMVQSGVSHSAPTSTWTSSISSSPLPACPHHARGPMPAWPSALQTVRQTQAGSQSGRQAGNQSYESIGKRELLISASPHLRISPWRCSHGLRGAALQWGEFSICEQIKEKGREGACLLIQHTIWQSMHSCIHTDSRQQAAVRRLHAHIPRCRFIVIYDNAKDCDPITT
jgi:hypothetical protein